MKTPIVKIKSIGWVLLIVLGMMFNAAQARQGEVSFQIFYDELSPHGRWLLHPRYGDVWAPNVQGEFTPYLTNGYWTVTQYGNTWVSNYDWGWATFHYGRWYFDDFEGWVWIPDTEWAPAWVVWRNGGGYYGWAAMSPGINFSVSFSLFNDIPDFYWCFVPQQYVWRPFLYRYCAPRHRNVYIVSNTAYVSHYTVNNITYNYYTGPSHTEIKYVTNRPVVVHQVERGSRPGRSEVTSDKITMYTPTIKRNEMERPALGGLGSNNGWGKGPVRGDNSEGNNPGGFGNGNGNGGQGNNGHGNGDQDAPGNSGGHNNSENSDNGGQGNSGNGKGGNDGRSNTTEASGRTRELNERDDFESWKRAENNNARNYRATEIKKSSNSNTDDSRMSRPNSGRSTNGRSFSGSNDSGANTKSYTPRQSNSSSGNSRSVTPSSNNSGGSRKSYTPSRSSGSSGNNSRSITPSRGSGSSGGSRSGTPSRSSGGSSGGSVKSKSRN